MESVARSFLLLVGCEGALLVPPESMEDMPIFLPAHHKDADAQVPAMLARHPRIPVIVLAESDDETVRPVSLPPVAARDRRRLAERRLREVFPDAPLVASLGTGSRSALLAAAHAESAALRWFDLLTAERPETAVTLGLLAVESAPMIARLAPESAKGWGMIVSWQRCGGLLQIVTQGGALVFTRHTPATPEGTTAYFDAASLALEIQATFDYLARFGLTSAEAMRLVVLAPTDLHDALHALRLPVHTLVTLTPHEAAVRLRLAQGPAPDEPASDLVHAAWLRSRNTLRLPLMSDTTRARRTEAHIRRGGWLATALVASVALIWLGLQGGELTAHIRAVRQQRSERAALEQALATERGAQTDAPDALGQLRRALERQRLFSAPAAARPDAVIAALAQIRPPAIRATRLTWTAGDDAHAPSTLAVTLRVTDGNAALNELDSAVRHALPGATVALLHAPGASDAILTITGGTP